MTAHGATCSQMQKSGPRCDVRVFFFWSAEGEERERQREREVRQLVRTVGHGGRIRFPTTIHPRALAHQYHAPHTN